MSPNPLPTWREANASIFQPTVARAAQNLGIPALPVEKDYWVCQALRTMEAAHPGITVFKGATSLGLGFMRAKRFCSRRLPCTG
ncbi:MAG: hypothetical protein HQ453_05605 [Actinobacteria bacterium]|nr:hypothetical protein [Actinomycetota bacterium]